MNWLMRNLLIIEAFIIGCAISACAISTSAVQNHPLKIWAQNTNGAYSTLCVVDENTGVNYVVVSAEACNDYTIAITPRLNADGTLYVSGG